MSKIAIETQDILGLNVIVTLQSLHFPAQSVMISFLKPLYHADFEF